MLERADGGCEALLPVLATFVELVLSGNTPASICQFFFGANITALEKNGVGIRSNCCWLYPPAPRGQGSWEEGGG